LREDDPVIGIGRMRRESGLFRVRASGLVVAERPARGYIQITSGYGESLTDYNFRQTTLGLGFVYREW